MSNSNLERWHQYLAGTFEGGLDALLADDCVFYSPIVFTPQKGKELTMLYLSAAGATFSEGEDDKAPGQPESKFHYRKQVASDDTAILEFESEIDGKYINGVDMITFDDEGKIVEFKVMIRPLQAINLMHEKMRAMLANLTTQDG